MHREVVFVRCAVRLGIRRARLEGALVEVGRHPDLGRVGDRVANAALALLEAVRGVPEERLSKQIQSSA